MFSTDQPRVPNALIGSTSPYLLQHAYNPVQWYPWGEAALEKARSENKLLLVSIGYSACHWCHVMERESFEDEEVAAVMNKSFVCIKVDREERPDLDQVYMDAVQLMTGRGGWPLNVIALPDQRPVYGGTYFPKEQWREILLRVAAMFREDAARCEMYAAELAEGVRKLGQVPLMPVTAEADAFPDHAAMLQAWSSGWDKDNGGPLRAPKFPLPDSYRYLLAAAVQCGDIAAEAHVHHTLLMMGRGGIYDQIGGGFARYSTDLYWKVPHFEKMLYDNALLLSLYADAYRRTGDAEYAFIIRHTIDWLRRDMLGAGGVYFSALDADSEGVEGKYYCWNPDELQSLLGEDFVFGRDYFHIREEGYWEHDLYIPLRKKPDEEWAAAYGLSLQAFQARCESIRHLLLTARSKRVPPGIDDKFLCSWNALLLTGLLDAAGALKDDTLQSYALELAQAIRRVFVKDAGQLIHHATARTHGLHSEVPGFLDDYACMIEAFLQLWSCTGAEDDLQLAVDLSHTVEREFSASDTGLCWYTSSKAESLFARKQEVQDNVIPSGNAVMAHNFLRMARIFGDTAVEQRCRRMLQALKEDTVKSVPWYNRWARVWLELEHGSEVVVSGPEARAWQTELRAAYLPLSLLAVAHASSDTPLLSKRHHTDRTKIYICRNHVCEAPLDGLDQALQQLGA